MGDSSSQILRRTTLIPRSNSPTHSNRRVLGASKSCRFRDSRLDLSRRVPTLTRTVRNRQRDGPESSLPFGLSRREFGDRSRLRKVLFGGYYEWNSQSVGYVSEDAWVRSDSVGIVRHDFDEGLFLTSRES